MYAFIFFFDWPHFLLFKFHSPCSAIWTVGRSLQTSTKQTISFALFCVIIALTRTCAESIRKRKSLSSKPRLRRWECKSDALLSRFFSHFFASTPKPTKTKWYLSKILLFLLSVVMYQNIIGTQITRQHLWAQPE